MSIPAEPATPRPRIQALSDMIFGLALSIGALTLIGKALTGTPEMQQAQITGAVIAFGFSFLILISVWLRYTSVMSVLPVDPYGGTLLNVLLLFFVSIEPYFFNLLSVSSIFDFATSSYALDLGGLFAILGLFTHQLTLEERNLIPKELMNRYRITRNREIATATLFLVSALPPFGTFLIVGQPARFLLWTLSFVLSRILVTDYIGGWIRRSRSKQEHAPK